MGINTGAGAVGGGRGGPESRGDRGGGSRTGSNSGGGGRSSLPPTKKPGLTDNDILGLDGWGSNEDPNGPTIERVQRASPFAPSGPNERWGFNSPTNPTDPGFAQQQKDYNSAWDDQENRGFGGWLRDHLLDVVPGFRQEMPNWNDPASFKNGIYHDSWSPWGAAASVVGMAAPFPGTSTLTGYLGNKAADELGGDRYVFGGGGWGPAVDAPDKTVNPKADAKAAALAGQRPTPDARTSQGQGALLSPVMGDATAAAPTAPAPSGSQLLPVAAPSAPQMNPGAWMGVPGPSNYGWLRPSWAR